MSGSAARSPRDERGVSLGGYMMLFAVIGTLGGVLALLLTYIAAAHQASTAADLSALAGTQASMQGRDACSAAKAIAKENRAELLTCETQGQAVTVQAAVRVVQLVPGLPEAAIARAAAEPVGP